MPSLLLAGALLVGSCRILRGDPLLECCGFDTASSSVIFSCGDERIIRYETVLPAAQQGEYGTLLTDTTFKSAVRSFPVRIDDSLKSEREIIIHLWTSGHTIPDYTLYVTAADWQAKAIIHGSFNAR